MPIMAWSAEKQLSVREKRYERMTETLHFVREENGNGFSTSFEGFKFDDFNRAGLMSLPKLCKYFESFRYVSWRNLLGMKDSAVGTSFVIQLHVEISKELYKQASLSSKLKLLVKLAHCGQSSATVQTSLTDESSGSLLASEFRSTVHVNRTTRKAEPFSDEFRQRVAEILDGCQIQIPPKLIRGVMDIKRVYSCTIVVKNIDMDNNDHATSITYFDYLLECAAQAAAAGHYTKLKGDICGYCVKMASLVHTSESHAGDELTVTTCEDPSNPLLLYFSVATDKRDISHAVLEYYDPHIESNL